MRSRFVSIALTCVVLSISTAAQLAVSSSTSAQVPSLIRFSGRVSDEGNQPISGTLGITFALYRDQQGGAPLWIETQNVKADAGGHYTVMLGATKSEGMPLDLFTSGEARWLGVTVENHAEASRVLLVSVPYAIKAHEAETLAGRSISDFVLNDAKNPQAGTGVNSTRPGAEASSARNSTPPPPAGPTTFTGSNTTQIVGVTQSGTGTGVNATATTHAALAGYISGTSNTAVYGQATNTAAGSNAAGVTGVANTQFGPGVQGVTTSSTGLGVQGVVNASSGGTAVQGLNNSTSGLSSGVQGQASSVTTNSAGISGFEAAATGQVYGVGGSTNSTTTNAAGVSGYEGAATGRVYGVSGGAKSTTTGAAAINGFESASSGLVYGVQGSTNSKTTGAAGVNGYDGATSGVVYGVQGGTASTAGYGVNGYANATSGAARGVSGTTRSPTGVGVFGWNSSTTGSANGVAGQTDSTSGDAVVGSATATSGPAIGVLGVTTSPNGAGGAFTNLAGGTSAVIVANGGPSITQIFSVDASGNGIFAGNLHVNGSLSKGSGSFKIDHPLDPANKYLSHSFVESPDMMNVYNGNVTTDRHGLAKVDLPEYFEALNRDFRYQLTVIGQFAQAIVKQEIANNQFTIKTSKPAVKVSWLVTGVRQDAYAKAHRIPVEEEKDPGEQGHYLHPELFGASEEQAIGARSTMQPADTPHATAETAVSK